MKHQNQGRKAIKLSDIVIIVIILAICLTMILFFYRNNTKDNVAVISYDGKIVKQIDLTTAKDAIFKLENNPRVSFQVSNGKIRFVETQCPDKLCENVGYISRTNQVAICMPNKVTLKTVSKKQDFDIIVN